MPHASTITRISPLEFKGEKPQRASVRWSCLIWDISGLDRGTGAKKVLGEFIDHLMIWKTEMLFRLFFLSCI
jgi:hypothetical protein